MIDREADPTRLAQAATVPVKEPDVETEVASERLWNVIAWNDPRIGVAWPTERPQLSKRDREAPPLETVLAALPHYEPNGTP